MILTLIGMSRAGKTFWASRLEAHGFRCFHCDRLLAAKLNAITGASGATLEEMGRWMGMPYEPDFRRREALYVACETDVLRDVIASAASCADNGPNCVIDTGGSAIYASTEIFEQLHRFSTVVYLAIPADRHQQMLEAYIDNPLPLIWDGLFQPEHDESLQDTFVRCYSQLIKHRERLYEQYSDIKLEYSYHRKPALTTDAFLQHIQALG
jgi:shikimate kinase